MEPVDEPTSWIQRISEGVAGFFGGGEDAAEPEALPGPSSVSKQYSEGPSMVEEVDPGVELGSTGLKEHGGYVHEEWHPRLRGRLGQKVYREMRDNDATVGATLYAIESLILQAPWNVEARGKDPTPSQIAARDFTRGALFADMSHTWQSTLSEILSMVWSGWSYFEVVYKRRNGADASPPSAFDDGRIGWRKFAIRAQDTLDKWEFDEHGGVRGMWQNNPYSGGGGRVFIPIEKSLLFTFRSFRNNPEGRSALRNAYRSWYFLKRLQEIEAVGTERDLVGLPVMKVPPEIMSKDANAAQKKQRADAFKTVKNLRRDEQEGVLMPSKTGKNGKPTGWDLELLASGGKRTIDIAASINRYSKEIAMSLLAQFLFLGMDRVGSFALADESTNLFAASLAATMDRIVEVINRHAIPKLMRLNGIPQEDWPVMVHGDVETRDLKTLASFVSSLVGVGALDPEGLDERLREIAHLPPREREPEEEEAPTEAKVLTGIQIKTAAEIAGQVALNELRRDQGIALLQTFFGLSMEAAERIVGAAAPADDDEGDAP